MAEYEKRITPENVADIRAVLGDVRKRAPRNAEELLQTLNELEQRYEKKRQEINRVHFEAVRQIERRRKRQTIIMNTILVAMIVFALAFAIFGDSWFA